MKITTVGNWAYAGTGKFVSHAVNEAGTHTLCNMSIDELFSRPNQQWEDGEVDGDSVGCKRCNRHLTQRGADLLKAGRNLPVVFVLISKVNRPHRAAHASR